MIYLLTSIWTVIILFLGFASGYLVGHRDLDKKIEQIKSNAKKISPNSGPVKMLTKIQREAEKDTEGSKIRELTQ